MEIWRDVVGYEGLYKVSNCGQVMSIFYNKDRILRPAHNQDGYLSIVLCKDKTQKSYKVHRLVAIAFIETDDYSLEVEHLNAIPDDNRVENLKWSTHDENMVNPITKKRISDAIKGENHPLYGTTMSEETKDKIRKSMPDHRGNNSPRFRSGKAYKGCNIETGEVLYFETCSDFKNTTFHYSQVCSCCTGKARTHKGYTWEAIERDEYEELIKG